MITPNYPPNSDASVPSMTEKPSTVSPWLLGWLSPEKFPIIKKPSIIGIVDWYCKDMARNMVIDGWESQLETNKPPV